MMDRTDRHCRVFLRALATEPLLYTEMVTTGAILHGDRDRLLAFREDERPLALQLGGDDPAELAACARIAEARGFDEINLNVGCPSDRVQRGRFGACLMKEPERVARAVAAMRAAVTLPVTVKHRIGVDEMDGYDALRSFVDMVAAAGCDRFTIHARKAWLAGLSPKENRSIPPLRHEFVHRLKRERPGLAIETNGGLEDLDDVASQLFAVDAVMLGRAVYERPWILGDADRRLFGAAGAGPTRRRVVERMAAYVEEERRRDVYLSRITRHMLGLMAGLPGARAWRRMLTLGGQRPGAGPEVLLEALRALPSEALDAPASADPPPLTASAPERSAPRPSRPSGSRTPARPSAAAKTS
jgi:tRNA-dihydrouridine synthase A